MKVERPLLIRLLISLHSTQDELEAVHHLYPTLFYFMHFWKETQLYTNAEKWADDEVCQEDGLFKLLAPVVQRVDNVIQWISIGKTNYAIRWIVLSTV